MSSSDRPPDESRDSNPEKWDFRRLTPRLKAGSTGSASPILSLFALVVLAGFLLVPPAVSAPTPATDATDRLTAAPVPTAEPTPTPAVAFPGDERVPRRWSDPAAPTPTPTRPPVVVGAGGGPTGGSA